MRPEISLKIKEEVRKHFDAGFLAVARYPEWVANIVPVPKKDGKVRMCEEGKRKVAVVVVQGLWSVFVSTRVFKGVQEVKAYM